MDGFAESAARGRALDAEHPQSDPFAAAIRATRMAMVITDARQDDNPIIFVNPAFERLTGFSRAQVIGKNCRFLQGPDTDRDDVAAVGRAVREGRDVHCELLNYRADGTTFWNALYLSPVFNDAGEIEYFFGSQLDVTDKKRRELEVRTEKARIEEIVERRTAELREALEAKTVLLHEVDHRVKNNLQLISSLITMQARRIGDAETRASLMSMLSRVDALSTVHRRLYQSDDVSTFDVAQFARDLATDLVAASGRTDIEVRLTCSRSRCRRGRRRPSR